MAAPRLTDRTRYGKQAGAVLCLSARIDFIILFHKSSWKESLFKALGLEGYSDYTEFQNEKPLDPNRKIGNFDPSEYWDFSKTGDENAQIYLDKCRKDGRIPKFPQFASYPGYWKLLIDFKMYDNNGVGVPQQVVSPVFNDEVNADILNSYEGGHRAFPVAKDVVTDFVKDYQEGKTKGEKSFSHRKKQGSYDYSKPFSEQIDDLDAGKIPVRDTLLVGSTSNVLRRIGFATLPVTYPQNHARTVLQGTAADHDFGKDILKQLPTALARPVAVIRSSSHPTTSVVVISEFTHNGKQIIEPILIDGTGRENDSIIDSYVVTSAHKRGNAAKLLYDAIIEESRGNVIGTYFLDKEKTTRLLSRYGLQLPTATSMPDGYIHKITDSNAEVNPQIQDNTKTKQFRRWFDDSAVADENGEPMVVYHGTTARFDVFQFGDIGFHVGTEAQARERFRTDRTGEDAWKNEDIRFSHKNKKDIRDDIYYPRNARDAHAFIRSFANKSSNLKKGQKNTTIIFTEDKQYTVLMDGYLTGEILSVTNLENGIPIDQFVEEWNNDKNAETVDQIAEEAWLEHGRNKGSSESTRIGKAAGQLCGVDSRESSSKPIANNREGGEGESGDISKSLRPQQQTDSYVLMNAEALNATEERILGRYREKIGVLYGLRDELEGEREALRELQKADLTTRIKQRRSCSASPLLYHLVHRFSPEKYEEDRVMRSIYCIGSLRDFGITVPMYAFS